jgi:N-methylhydantoinase B
MRQGDVLHSVMQSGGGWGDPLDRDPAAVLEDLLDEKIDCDRARSIYGVALAADGLSVDFEATRSLRAEHRAAARR